MQIYVGVKNMTNGFCTYLKALYFWFFGTGLKKKNKTRLLLKCEKVNPQKKTNWKKDELDKKGN